MKTEFNPIDLRKLKELIRQGVHAIPVDRQNSQAVIVIGDTGVGKSTILSFLNGSQLIVKFDRLKYYIDTSSPSQIQIGTDKLSKTSIPTKVKIQNISFFDCPGFKDNKGQEYEISNSFFIQRLLDIYQHVKIVLIVDESHISEARADKLPKLLRNLHKSFKTFEDIKDGCILIINRTDKENNQEDYHNQLIKLMQLKNQNGYLFEIEERRFIEYMMGKDRVLLFREARKQNVNKNFEGGPYENKIMSTIKESSFVRSKKIQNILSQSTKLAIRDFIDEITNRSNNKIEIICLQILEIYNKKVRKLGKDVKGMMILRETIVKLAQTIKTVQNKNIINILQSQLPPKEIQSFQEDFSAIMFFKGIYDRTNIYFSNLRNKIYSQLSILLTKIDKKITILQRQIELEKLKQKEELQQRYKEEEKQKKILKAKQHRVMMEDLKTSSATTASKKVNLIQEVRNAMKCLNTVSKDLKRVKSEVIILHNKNKDIQLGFSRLDRSKVEYKTITES